MGEQAPAPLTPRSDPGALAPTVDEPGPSSANGRREPFDLRRPAAASEQSTVAIPPPKAPPVREGGGFELLSPLGAGGMGEVWKARQKSLSRIVALKLLTPKLAKDADYVKRFLLEAQAAAKLNHPHVVQVFDQGVAGETRFIAFEFIDGCSLEAEVKKRGKLPEREALRIVREIA